ncbi:MAG: hypothetical protein NW201_09195 [Gemmatimonadales bacterium]|nr:hypothetical protein [Gemmatimonadales bacterium]
MPTTMANPATVVAEKPYPPTWEETAEIRVFRTAHAEWDRLSQWFTDMRRHGWRLLRVTSDTRDLVAIFGKTRVRPGAR